MPDLHQALNPPSLRSESITGPVIDVLFRSPRSQTAADHKRDQDGNKYTKFQSRMWVGTAGLTRLRVRNPTTPSRRSTEYRPQSL
jgi:hypothetical protein